MNRIFCLLLLLLFTINCSNPVEKNKINEEIVQKEIEKIRSSRQSSNPIMTINNIKKVKRDAQAISYDLGVVRCNLILMNDLTTIGNEKEAIDIAKQNEVLINKLRNDFFSCEHYILQGTAYLNLGIVDHFLNDLEKALEYAKKIPIANEKYVELARIYHLLANNEVLRGDLFGQKLQSFHQKELWAIQQIDNSKKMETKKNMMLSFFYLDLGVVSNRQKKIKEAEYYFHKALATCKKFNIKRDIPVLAHNEIAWLLFDQKKYDSCIAYAQKGMLLEKKDSKADIRRDLYEVLYKSYSEKKDIQNSAKYTKLYMKLNDSILDAQQKIINDPVKNIINEKEIDHKSNVTSILTIFGISVLVSAILIVLFWRKNQKVLHIRYEKIINELNIKENEILLSEQITDQQSTEPEKKFNIHDDTINQILSKLDKFEKSERFLKKDMNLSYLANSINTNPHYLSVIINQYKGKNFNNYLNGLRIRSLIKLLYERPVYREYKIAYLSEHCGFVSRDVFGIAFKKETGVTPSYFINQLKIDQEDIAKNII